ncbi:MAG TPA: 50S ribosomal protein L10 [Candidatus Angelobacter sp.]|jgi:large subunit ribosomal protein L10|nr:50S ribosomal protein L10 [Candidatus Angelobacter sp.]
MTRKKKKEFIESLETILSEKKSIYIVDISGLNAKEVFHLRKSLLEAQVKIQLVKNTLLKKALKKNFNPFYNLLKGGTALISAEPGNKTIRIMKNFRTQLLLKGAYVEESFYIGDENFEVLANIKSREELLKEALNLLQTPLKSLLSIIQSGVSSILHFLAHLV